MLSRGLSDLSLYKSEGALDLDVLAYSLYLKEQQQINMITHVDPFTSSSAKVNDRLLLGRKTSASSRGPKADSSSVPALIEVRFSDMQTPPLLKVIESVKGISPKAKLWSSSKRYITDIKLLRGVEMEEGKIGVKIGTLDFGFSYITRFILLLNADAPAPPPATLTPPCALFVQTF